MIPDEQLRFPAASTRADYKVCKLKGKTMFELIAAMLLSPYKVMNGFGGL